MTFSEKLNALINTPAVFDPVKAVAESIERMTTEQLGLLAEMIALAGLEEPRDAQNPRNRHALFETISSYVIANRILRAKDYVVQFEGAGNLLEFWERIDRAALREPNNGDY